MSKPIHVMLRVFDEQRSLKFYESALGFHEVARISGNGYDLIYLGNDVDPMEIELTINHDRERPYDLGDGYGHVALVVADLDEEHTRMSGGGHAPGDIKELMKDGVLAARFFFIQDPDGYKFEIIQRSARYK